MPEGFWLIEAKNKLEQGHLLPSHRQLELLLEALSETTVGQHEETAMDLRIVPHGILPEKVTRAERHQQAKQHQNEIWDWINTTCHQARCSW